MASSIPPEPPESAGDRSIAIMTFIAARDEAQRELVDERIGRVIDRVDHSEDLRRREHKQTLAAMQMIDSGLGLLRERIDKHLDDHEKRIDSLESSSDRLAGGRNVLREAVTVFCAIAAIAIALANAAG